MLAATAHATQSTKFPVPVLIKQEEYTQQERLTFKELVSQRTRRSKNVINWASNSFSAVCSIIAFVCGNFIKSGGGLQEKLNCLSEVSQRIGIFLSGVPGTADMFQKKNFFATIGYFSYFPVSIFTKGYELWLARGVSSSLINSILVLNQREANVNERGDPVPDTNGKIQYLTGDFGDKPYRGFLENIKDWKTWKKSCMLMLQEGWKMLKELCKKPSNIKKFTHSVLVTSIIQLISPGIGFIGGPKKLEAFVRNTAGIGSYIALALDASNKRNSSREKNNNAEKSTWEILKSIDLKSPTVWSSICRIITSVVDFFKRFEFVSGRITNLTDISLMLDRIASMFYSQGVFNIKNGK